MRSCGESPSPGSTESSADPDGQFQAEILPSMTLDDCHRRSTLKGSWPWLMLALAAALVAWKSYSQGLLVAPETPEAVEQQAICFALLATASAFGLMQWLADGECRYRHWHAIELLAVMAAM